ncbi:MAG TPA: GrpB family protein [Candidatus Thermoplasmatota archaeon]|nr:GrpB family protein [Candidatus Thermoplasmatota archaeon]
MRVELRPYDPAWPLRFERERARLAAALGARARSIEHFGSTSVPGLAAKPILDVLVARVPGALYEEWVTLLAPLGLTWTRRDSTDQGEGQWYFRDVADTMHVHVYEADTRAHRRHLAFRDALRADATLREEYAALKRDLATKEWGVVQDYADAKTAFVRRVEKEWMRE